MEEKKKLQCVVTHPNNTLLLLKEEAEFPLFVSLFFFLVLFIYIIYFSEHFSSEIPRDTSKLEKEPLFWSWVRSPCPSSAAFSPGGRWPAPSLKRRPTLKGNDGVARYQEQKKAGVRLLFLRRRGEESAGGPRG